jgi:RNA polymerase sigma-70 factor (ECF subfamily)
MCSEAAYFPSPLQTMIVDHPGKNVDRFGASDPTDLAGTSDTDEDLLCQAGRGSKNALAVLFHRYYRKVLNVAHRILKDVSEAEDLCQEVFIFVLQRARLFDPAKGAASSWIIQIAYHRAINRRQYLTHRQHYASQEFNEEQIVVGPSPLLVSEINSRNLLALLRALLSQEQRETLELHFFEGYSLREIAEKRNQTIGNVRHHYYRGLERLRSLVFPTKDA